MTLSENPGPSHLDTPAWIRLHIMQGGTGGWAHPLYPPAWIRLHIMQGGTGGWAHPLYPDAFHPLVTAGWKCFICDKAFEAEQAAIVTPYHGEESRWVAYHRDFCFTDCLGIERTPVLRFLSGSGKDGSGRRLDDVLEFTNEEVEKVHDWVQWVFPLPEPSQFQNCPLLTPWDIQRLREDERLRANVTRSVDRYLTFLATTTDWLSPRDHNHLRITRVLRFLTLIGRDDTAESVYKKVTEAMRETGFDFDQSLWYWTEAKNLIPSWLVEDEVRRLRGSGMEDNYIARELVDNLFRVTGLSMHDEQHLVEQLVRQIA